MNYYNKTCAHLSLDKDTHLSRAVQRVERILRLPILGGLHHEYIRDLICARHKPKESNFETDHIFLSRR